MTKQAKVHEHEIEVLVHTINALIRSTPKISQPAAKTAKEKTR